LQIAVSWTDDGETSQPEPTGGMEKWASDTEEAAGGDARELLHYRMTLTAPCVLHGDDLDPNSCRTLDYLPGSTVRGAMARALEAMAARAPEGSGERARAEMALRRIIAGEEAEFLNAYFETSDARRPLPTPITWRRMKDIKLEDHKADPYDAASVFTGDAGEPEGQTEPLKTRYVTPDDGALVPLGGEGWSRIGMETHQTRYRERGVPQPGKSTVYVYEAIRPGEALRGAVRVPPDLAETVAAALEGGGLRLGRSARAHYGGAPRVTVVAAAPNDEADRPLPVSVRKGERFEIVLTSPALLRHPLTGQHDPSCLYDAAQERFRGAATVATCVLKFMSDGDGSGGGAFDAPPAAFVKGTTARGYVRQWRTELPRLPAAAAGSVVVLKADRDLTGNELAALCAEPLGERTADGYGRFIAENMRDGLSLTPPGETEGPSEPNDETDSTMVAAQKRLYRNVLRRLLVEEALRRMQEAVLLKPRITPSLLHRFRGALRSDSWPETFKGWFAASPADPNRLRPTAYEAAKRVRIQPLNDTPEDRDARKPKPLTEMLRQAASSDWIPPIPIDKGGEWRSYALLPIAQAEQEWNNARRELRTFFLDRLLGALAKRAAQEAEMATRAEQEEG
jgi:CRISPR-associated protein Csx10